MSRLRGHLTATAERLHRAAEALGKAKAAAVSAEHEVLADAERDLARSIEAVERVRAFQTLGQRR